MKGSITEVKRTIEIVILKKMLEAVTGICLWILHEIENRSLGQEQFESMKQNVVSLIKKQLTYIHIECLQETFNPNSKSFYGIDVSPSMISKITDKVMDAAAEWLVNFME